MSPRLFISVCFLTLAMVGRGDNFEQPLLLVAPPAPGEVEENLLKPGPWGKIYLNSLYLEPPEATLSALSLPSGKPIWEFGNLTNAQVNQVFVNAGIPDEFIAQLFSGHRKQPTGIQLFPPLEIVQRLTPTARATVYQVLAMWPANKAHQKPFVFADKEDLYARFTGSEVPREIVEVVEQLCYPLGDALAFADLPLVLSAIESREVEMDLFQTLHRRLTLTLELELTAESDLPALAQYWGPNAAGLDHLPQLQSLARGNPQPRIDISHFLPTIPRRQLYTYPGISDGINGRYPDSLWTALNFFEFPHINTYWESPSAQARLQESYLKTPAPFRYGDLLFLMETETQRPLHGCVFIADDVVYSKNSADLLTPWVFSRLSNVRQATAKGRSIYVTGYRPR